MTPELLPRFKIDTGNLITLLVIIIGFSVNWGGNSTRISTLEAEKVILQNEIKELTVKTQAAENKLIQMEDRQTQITGSLDRMDGRLGRAEISIAGRK